MNAEAYSALSSMAGYGFALLMLFVVLRAFVMTYIDAHRAKALRKAAQPIGVLSGNGADYPVPESGYLGSGRHMDIVLSGNGICRKHAYFEQREGGVLFESVRRAPIRIGKKRHKAFSVFAQNGDVLCFGEVSFTLLLYAASERKNASEDFFSEES